MKVPFHLRRRPAAEAVAALLLLTDDANDVVKSLVALAGGAMPAGYAVAGGVLVKSPTGTEYSVLSTQYSEGPDRRQALCGTICLRALAENLFLPVDAELLPALLPDEAAALTAERGLVFLPGGRVLEFQADQPLAVRELLHGPAVRRRRWKPFPERPALAARLEEIELVQPETPPDELLEAGGEGVGVDEPRPDAAGLPASVAGKAALGLGKGLMHLGKALGLKSVAKLGADIVRRAVDWAPRLTEEILGKQEAALRALLKDFRDGNIERALRRALPMGESPRGSKPAGGTSLPNRNIVYSLGKLLGANGPADLWFGSRDVWQELRAEYRRLAERAAAEGDFRRAAYIYGKLLADYRAAADVLARGGLHRDAAQIYLLKLGDAWRAAREYEAAGEFDKALALYRQRGAHFQAAELLRRMGEEEAAVAEFRLVADEFVRTGQGHYPAGEMLLTRAKLPELAREYFEAGWRAREAENAVPCATRLAQLYAQGEESDQLLTLVAEASRFLEGPGFEKEATEFYNEVARLADRPALTGCRDELRDRALLGLAVKLRERLAFDGRPADLASRMLGQGSVWAPAVVSDAQFAVRAARGRPHRG